MLPTRGENRLARRIIKLEKNNLRPKLHVDFKTSLRRLCDCLSEWNNRSAVVNHIPGELALQLEDIRIGMHDGTTNMCW